MHDSLTEPEFIKVYKDLGVVLFLSSGSIAVEFLVLGVTIFSFLGCIEATYLDGEGGILDCFLPIDDDLKEGVAGFLLILGCKTSWSVFNFDCNRIKNFSFY